MEFSEFDRVSLRLESGKLISTGITSATITDTVLDPTPEATITISDDRYQDLLAEVVGGSTIQILVNDHPVMTGPLVDIQQTDSDWTLKAFGFLHRVIISPIQPTQRFERSETAFQFFDSVLEPYGEWEVFGYDDANQKLLSGQAVTGGRVDLTGKKLEQLKPKPNEACGSFLDRVAKRKGLLYWGSGDGTQVIVAQPNFEDGDLSLLRLVSQPTSRANNILNGSKRITYERQPSMVVVAAKSGTSGSEAKARHKAVAFNELTGTKADFSGVLPSVEQWMSKHPSAAEAALRQELKPYRSLFAAEPPFTPFIMEDGDSSTQEEVDSLARRTLAEFQHQAFQVQYQVAGLSQDGKLWAPNTMVNVRDERFGINQRLYVFSRTFTKSPQGTSTNLTLILPYTIGLAE